MVVAAVTLVTRLGDSILCLALTRTDMSILNLVAWHGRHDEPGFSVQMDAIEDVGLSAQPALILGDVNRREPASRTALEVTLRKC